MNYKEELLKSPIFWMSLSSKELFHTNFIAWALNVVEDDLRGTIFKALFDEELRGDIIIEREKDNIDLLVKANDNLYVVENKVKDVVCEDQIRKIEKVQADKYVLLTLLEYNPFFSMQKWVVRTYTDFVRHIDCISVKNIYHHALLKDYIRMVNLLISFVNENCQENKYNFIWANKDVLNQYKDVRLLDLFIKYNSSKLLSYIVNFFKPEKNILLLKGYSFRPTFNFSNNHGIIDIFWSNNIYTIGIQLEDKYFRKVFVLNNGNTERIYKKLREKNIWFSSTWMSRNKKEFCSYDANNDKRPTFIYQYDKKYLSINTDFSEICDRILDSMNEIYDNHEAIMDLFSENSNTTTV